MAKRDRCNGTVKKDFAVTVLNFYGNDLREATERLSVIY